MNLLIKKNLMKLKRYLLKVMVYYLLTDSIKDEKIYLEFAILRKNCLKNLIVNTFNVLALVQPQLK